VKVQIGDQFTDKYLSANVDKLTKLSLGINTNFMTDVQAIRNP
jgi:hypothetical protein